MSVFTQKQLRQRRFYTVLPIITYPFLTLLFWSMGGGKAATSKGQAAPVARLNTSLPEAANRNGSIERLSLYELAEKDSARLAELRRQDAVVARDTTSLQFAGAPIGGSSGPLATVGNDHIDPNEVRAQETLQKLQRQLDEAAQARPVHNQPVTELSTIDTDLDRIKAVMGAAGEQPEGDGDLKTISQMLDKIKEIQHPELEREKIRRQSERERGRVFPVSPSVPSEGIIKIMGSDTNFPDTAFTGDSVVALHRTLVMPTGQFYELTESSHNSAPNIIPAVVYRSATIVNNSTVQFMLTGDMYVNGQLVPKGTFVYGVAQIANERVLITITSIQYQHSIFAVNLLCYGADGQEGIPAPGAITQDAASQGMDNTLQMMNMGASIDPSIGSQAANAGIQTARSFLSRKVKMVKTGIKAGDPVFLIDKAALNH
ncbi:conjugative transposon TraM protein [Chitinophaga terrae (ex Kim and Jung 2007)]|uniref:conjugative transposon protein TraM n=1 Tax=Chitinophaga terrae (ex Kim and Jung 2007) TaxID=408074 RepID=UPI002785952D|nr:conjugative transposon protein TraM [Chitinophaga terrae (ex Kim and Jung 2007)]MDQ0107459.1 conjugative transposon TraM protein [Chitinophaga terrae (ex Kim and Jung 2007)]